PAQTQCSKDLDLACVELSGFLGTKIHGLSTDVQCETLSQHRSITMTQFLT
ncbi:hypothetical protein N657DRAFT_645954, partial [Parathielavia appendiculata]